MTEEILKKETVAPSENDKETSTVDLSNTEKFPDQIRWRNKFKNSEEKLRASETRAMELEKTLHSEIERISNSQRIAEAKRIEAEIKAAAVSEGMQDLDLIKVMDLSKVKVNEEGDIIGVNELVSAFKASKPQYFEREKKINSSLNIAIPGNEDKKKVNYLDMSNEEFRKTHANKFY